MLVRFVSTEPWLELPCLLLWLLLQCLFCLITNIATPAFLSFPSTWNIFFHLLTFNVYVSFALRWVSYRQQIEGFCFFIQSATLCLLIGAFISLTFKVIIDRYLFSAILNLVFQLILCLSFVTFFFSFGWFPFVLCLCPLRISFCECIIWFWFVVAQF